MRMIIFRLIKWLSELNVTGVCTNSSPRLSCSPTVGGGTWVSYVCCDKLPPTTQLYHPTALGGRSLKWVFLTGFPSVGPGGAAFLCGSKQGSAFWTFPAFWGHLHSLTRGPTSFWHLLLRSQSRSWVLLWLSPSCFFLLGWHWEHPEKPG